MQAITQSRYRSFSEFYAFYLSAHSHRWNRRFHFVGHVAGVLCFVLSVLTLNPWLLLAAPIVGYGLSWIGHFGIEGNPGATFSYPVYSFCSDVVMCKDILTGKIDW